MIDGQSLTCQMIAINKVWSSLEVSEDILNRTVVFYHTVWAVIQVVFLSYFRQSFTQPITFPRGSSFNGPKYSGDFPCSNINCPGWNYQLVRGQRLTSFPFQLAEELGQGGFARVVRGRFHWGEAAFKFIPIREDGYKYEWKDDGFHEYYQQEMITEK